MQPSEPPIHHEVVRALSEEQIRKIVPVLPYRTSGALNWSGVEVHRYRLPAGETREHSYPQLTVFLPHVETPQPGELRIAGRKIRAQIGNQSVSIAPPGVPLSSKRTSATEVTVIFLGSIADGLEIMPQYGIDDPLLRSLGMALDAEMTLPHPGHKTYAEALAAAMIAHILAKYSSFHFPRLDAMGDLRPQLKIQLGRSLKYIHDHLDASISLEELAEVANMSKYHFAKSFRHVVGVAPHQYLVKLRVERAQSLLGAGALSVEDVANRVGYSDPAHFAEQFRKIVGVSPNRYRHVT